MKKRLVFVVLFLITNINVLAQNEGANTLFQEGTLAIDQKQYAAAERTFSRFLKNFPEDSRSDSAEYLLGLSLYYQKDFKRAQDLFQKFPRKYPESILKDKTEYWKGSAEFGLLQFEKSLGSFLNQVQKNNDLNLTSKSLYFAALSAERLGNINLSIDTLSKLIPLSSQAELRLQGVFKLAVLALGKKQLPQIKAALSIFKIDYPQSPLSAEMKIIEAEFLALEGDIASAVSIFKTLESSDAVSNDIRQKALYRKAVLELSKLSKSDGIKSLEQLLNKYPENQFKQEILNTLAKEYLDSQRFSDAQKALENLLRSNLNNEEKQLFRNNLALVFSKQNLWLEAAKNWSLTTSGPDKEISAQGMYSAFFSYIKGGDTTNALKIGDLFLKTYPDHLRAEDLTKELAIIYGSIGNSEKRAELLTRLIERFPKSDNLPHYLLLRGADFEQKQSYSGALQDYQRIIKDFPKHEVRKEAQYRLGYVYSQKGEFLRAEGYFFTLAEELKSGDLYERCLLARAIAFANGEKLEKAKAVFDRLIKEVPKSPWALQGRVQLAKVEIKLGNYDLARSRLKDLIEISIDPRIKADAMWELAISSMTKKDFNSADADWSIFIKENPKDERCQNARFQRGLATFNSGNYLNAIKYFDEALGFSGFKEELLFYKGLSYLNLKRYQEASQTWDSLNKQYSLSFKPSEGWYKWGEMLWENGEKAEAASVWEQLIQRWEKSPWADIALPKAIAAMLQSGQKEKGLNLAKSILIRTTDIEKTLIATRSLGNALINLGDFQLWEKLLFDLKTLQVLPPIGAEINLAYAKSLIDTNEQKAILLLQEIARGPYYDDQKGQAYFVAGDHYDRIGNAALAKEYFTSMSDIKNNYIKATANFRLAQIEAKEGSYKSAIETLKVIGSSRESWGDLQANALFEAWKLAKKQKDEINAKEFAEKLLREWPNHNLTKQLN